MPNAPVVHSDLEIMGGTPVFVGTRVPFEALVDYMEGGRTLDEFLDDFPTVTKEMAVAALEAVGLDGIARHIDEWGAWQAVDRLNLDGLLALWHPPATN